MTYRGYPERDLVSNRSSLLLHGSTEAERRAWAEEAAELRAAEGSLKVVGGDAELRQVLGAPRGVVYIPEIGNIGDATQLELVRVLRERDERPKIIVGVTGKPDTAREAGRMRSDLQYALHQAQVNLDEPGLKEAIKTRRARAAKRPPAPKSPAPPAAAPQPKSAAPQSSAPASAAARPQKPPAASKAARTAKPAPGKPKPSTAAKSSARKPAARGAAPKRKTVAPRKAAPKKAKGRRR